MPARLTAIALGCFVAATASAAPVPAHPEHEVTAQTVVYQVPGMDAVTVRKNVPYKKTDTGALRLDLYYPPDFREGSSRPAVIFLNGVGDGGGHLKEWGIYASWGRLVAASGWIGVTFDTRGPFTQSGADIADLLAFVRSDGSRLGIRTDRLAAWVCSGNVESGLKVLMDDRDPGLRAAVVYYGASDVAAVRTDLPVFFVKAGHDNPRLNSAIDLLVGRAAAAGAPWTLTVAPTLHHAFDALDDTPESRRIVRETLAFFREYLSPPDGPTAAPSEARRALAFWFAHEYPEAAAAYGSYVKTHPDDAVAWMRLGIAQSHLEKPAEAEAAFQKAAALGATSATDSYNVACGYAILGRTDAALDALERAVKAGFDDKHLLSEDEDLERLRPLERFQKILDGLR